jgi:hypothetical protein
LLIRRFLMHLLPKSFHRIRHYDLFANGNRAADIARARELLAMSLRRARPVTQMPQSLRNCACTLIPARVAAAA